MKMHGSALETNNGKIKLDGGSGKSFEAVPIFQK